MKTLTTETQANTDFDQLKTKLKTTWSSGDYDVFESFMAGNARQFFDRLPVYAGARLLDVGCGTGRLALLAARAGAEARGCDIAPNWVAKAREHAEIEGLNALFDEADAESLPYGDAQFDIVTSLIGAMFAPRPDRVAAELKRVCRPGGVIAMGNWTPQGFVGQMFKIIARHIAPAGMPAPVLWGDEATVRERLSAGIADLKMTRRIYTFDYPFPPEAVVEFFRVNYGPMTRAFAALDARGQYQLRSELIQLWSSHNRSNESNTQVDAEYLEVIATKIDTRGRAERLAERVERGAAGLAALAEQLSEAEWNTPTSATDSRPVGVIVHHVASVYPIEIELARAIASGQPVTEVTWDAVAELNRQHAHDQREASRAITLELLRRNSHNAAEALRGFSDAELDRAAPFSLSYGAPVTAQFVIEDHAVRHSWHHLARIRKALNR